jgi:serine/threonine protein kinase
MFKRVPSQECSEVVVSQLVSGGPHVVSAEFHTAHAEDERRPLSGLLMPKYDRSLSEQANVAILDQDTLVKMVGYMIEALNHLHHLDIVHMDVKEANIFVSSDGEWWLGDFGSAVPHGQPIMSYTESCFPCSLMSKPAAACWEYDWYILVVVAVCQLGARAQLHDHSQLDTVVRNIVGNCDHVPLSRLLTALVDFKGAEYLDTDLN